MLAGELMFGSYSIEITLIITSSAVKIGLHLIIYIYNYTFHLLFLMNYVHRNLVYVESKYKPDRQ